MIAYLGKTYGKKTLALIKELSATLPDGVVLGEMVQRNEIPPIRHPWALDNGAYTDWKDEKPFNADMFLHAVEWVATHDDKPNFIALPDSVGNRQTTLDSTYRWGPKLVGVAPLYAVLQDGMTQEDIQELAEQDWLAGFFIGGTNLWKLKEGRWIVPLVHELGFPCHVGRIGSNKKVRWAKRLFVDSIDSAGPLWAKAKLIRFVKAVSCPLEEQKQTDDYWWL